MTPWLVNWTWWVKSVKCLFNVSPQNAKKKKKMNTEWYHKQYVEVMNVHIYILIRLQSLLLCCNVVPAVRTYWNSGQVVVHRWVLSSHSRAIKYPWQTALIWLRWATSNYKNAKLVYINCLILFSGNLQDNAIFILQDQMKGRFFKIVSRGMCREPHFKIQDSATCETNEPAFRSVFS